jgi:4-hydroxy 2-oxovalerate aldolase
MSNLFKVLDCTLRDGGYYTNWDFSKNIVLNYIKAMDELPIDFIEIGYRNIFKKDYYGEFFYTPINTIDAIKKITNKSLVLIINERELSISEIDFLLAPCLNKISLIRLAVDPVNLSKAILKAKHIKSMGFEVAFNVMYLSEWIEDEAFLSNLQGIENDIDYLYLVDSYGGVLPNQITRAVKKIKTITNVKLGFHGHNNLELALANTLASIDAGINIVDSTVMGMGRGAGNLKTELLISLVFKDSNIDFNTFPATLEDFNKLQKKYNWGTNLPYILAGTHSIPQKQIMNWILKGFYSFNTIVNTLNSKIYNKSEIKYQILNKNHNYERSLIIGGGETVLSHLEAIKIYLKLFKTTLIIFSSSRYLKYFEEYLDRSITCLVGNENERLNMINDNLNFDEIKFILPPSPREMGAFIPNGLNKNTFELINSDFLNKSVISHCSISIETSLSIGINNIFLTGFDGYQGKEIQSKEMEIFRENDQIFHEAKNNGAKLISITPTTYKNIITNSIYSLI